MTARKHIAALDGIRAIAIVAVIIYHMNPSGLTGGFLGVDVFFVLSGYLITWILLDRYNNLGSIDFKGFYLSRARRLLPAFFFLAFGVLVGVGLWAPDTIERFLQDLPWAATGTTNWWFIATGQDYFGQIGRPSLLQHTWSLAIEAQFYIIWPIVISTFASRIHLSRVRWLALSGAVFSWMALLWVAHYSGASAVNANSHMYFGTDTHSSGLFIGAALAVAWKPRNFKARISVGAKRFINAVSFGSLGVLLLTFIFVNELTGRFYLISFPIVGIATGLLIASVIHPASILAKWLSNSVVQWIGTRSYGLYLWHWIVIQVLRPGYDLNWATWQVVSLQLIILLSITEFSYRFIEMPVRRGVIAQWVQSVRNQTLRTRRLIASITAVSIALPLLLATAIGANAVVVSRRDPIGIGTVVNLTPSDSPTRVVQTDVAPTQVEETAEPRKVWVYGDSVVVGASQGFKKGFDTAGVRAEVALQSWVVMKYLIKHGKKHGGKYDVIFNIGVNGQVKEIFLTRIFDALAEVDRVVIINASVPRVWQDPNNELIAQVAARYPNVRIADWALASEDHPEYFISDGTHLTPAGVKAYVNCAQEAYLGP
jgi:peptidoglycan/LPS O-acetylase OafA/YrhL